MPESATSDRAIEVTNSIESMKKPPELRLRTTSHPLVYEVNSRALLNELSTESGRPITLGTIPDEVLDGWASLGFDAVWMMGIWTTGKIGLEIARTHEGLLNDYKRVLPDFSEGDVAGSPYAVKAYTVSPTLGGNPALLQLRKKLRQRGMGLLLDFVANHVARDHQWVTRHPEYFINGREGEEDRQPEYYFKTRTSKGLSVIAFGRDPNYAGWTDTAQLNIRHPDTRKVLVTALQRIATMCDGVRCDMALLLLNDVFDRTWGERSLPVGSMPALDEFWAEAIGATKGTNPDFKFIAEAYWDREWQLQQLGFDFTYDKKLYERLAREGAGAVYDHLRAETDYQRKCVRFIENHDEPRASQTFSSEAWHLAAATVMSTVPGMVLFHEGQLAGWKTKLPVQLCRRPIEEVSLNVISFYKKLLSILSHSVFREGEWKLLPAKAAWHENYTWSNFLAFWWFLRDVGARLIVVNYAPHAGQCYVELSLDGIRGSSLEFSDLIGGASYVRERGALATRGMYFDLPGYGVHIFDVANHKP